MQVFLLRRLLANALSIGFKFLDMPRELRDMVYMLCVGHGKIFFPTSWNGDTRYADRGEYEKPHLQVLAINSQTRAEAMEVLFGHNQIILSDVRDQQLFYIRCWDHSRTLKNQMQYFSAKFLTSISIAIDMRSNSLLPLEACVDRAIDVKHSISSGASSSNADRTALAHEIESDGPDETWALIANAAHKSPKLRHLQLDLTYAYCSLGCCRPISKIVSFLGAFVLCKKRHPALESVDILGLHTDLEQEKMSCAIRSLVKRFAWLEPVGQLCLDKKGIPMGGGNSDVMVHLRGFNTKAHREQGGSDFSESVPSWEEPPDWSTCGKSYVIEQLPLESQASFKSPETTWLQCAW